MTLKIFQPDTAHVWGPDPRTFFDINDQSYDLYFSPEAVKKMMIFHGWNSLPENTNIDMILLSHHCENVNYPKTKIFLEIWHNFEDQIRYIRERHVYLQNRLTDFYTITNAVDLAKNPINNIIFVDFLFNMVKAYYSNYAFHPDTDPWYYFGPQGYSVPDSVDPARKNKIYVAPVRVSKGRAIKYRPQLTRLLKEKYFDQGYIGENEQLKLHPQDIYPDHTLEQLLLITEHDPRGPTGYSPPHSEYYRDTFISIYTEAVERGSTIAVTEKTYDPMIKGHFILPFSCYGFIAYLKTLGYQFPKFIDYNYDSVVDDDQRFNKYLEEVQRLLAIDINDWRALWNDNYNILEHNQKIFQDRPYDRIDFNELLQKR